MLNEAPAKILPIPRGNDAPHVELLEKARSVFHEQARCIEALAGRIDESFPVAVDILLHTTGKVVVLGIGKSGLIGRKIAATLASTGTPSFFVQAGEAYHGDLGAISEKDSAILISQSGETDEVVRLIPHLQRLRVPMIGFTGNMDSTLATSVDVVLDVSVEREVCPNNLAPTNSTLAGLAMGDALAVALTQRRAFGPRDFAQFHPGGSLGRSFLTVREVMRKTDLPIVPPTQTIAHSLVTISEGRLGLVLVMKGDRLLGLVTDGDLRRAMQGMETNGDFLSRRISEICTTNPVTVPETMLLADAHQRMRQMKLKALVVTDSRGKVSGVVEVFEE